MITVGEMTKRFGLSRSTLLYYDSIGLLSPSKRSGSGYRLYSPKDIRRMEQVQTFRKAGLPLEEIQKILESEGGTFSEILEKHLSAINDSINELRHQQQMTIRLLKNKAKLKESRVMTKSSWVALLAASGLDEAGMHKWHVEFERMAPQAHQDFLESLGIGAEEIQKIRKYSAEGGQ